MAGVAALLNQSQSHAQGNLNPILYKIAVTPANTVFNDVTVASSGVTGCSLLTPSMCNNSTPGPASIAGGLSGFQVGAGFDEATGLGSINVQSLLMSWSNFLVGTDSSATAVVSNSNPSGGWHECYFDCDGYHIQFGPHRNSDFSGWFHRDWHFDFGRAKC